MMDAQTSPSYCSTQLICLEEYPMMIESGREGLRASTKYSLLPALIISVKTSFWYCFLCMYVVYKTSAKSRVMYDGQQRSER